MYEQKLVKIQISNKKTIKSVETEKLVGRPGADYDYTCSCNRNLNCNQVFSWNDIVIEINVITSCVYES